MRDRTFERGGSGVVTDLCRCVLKSPLGDLDLFASKTGLCGLFFDDHRGRPGWASDQVPLASSPFLDTASEELGLYFDGALKVFSVRLDLRGTDFQKRVWNELLAIRFGETATYGQLAERLGDPLCIRAAATANGRNPVSIIVPCHRVVGADGSLTGYAGGLERKRWLLDHESFPSSLGL